jgi:hypothetical protein
MGSNWRERELRIQATVWIQAKGKKETNFRTGTGG